MPASQQHDRATDCNQSLHISSAPILDPVANSVQRSLQLDHFIHYRQLSQYCYKRLLLRRSYDSFSSSRTIRALLFMVGATKSTHMQPQNLKQSISINIIFLTSSSRRPTSSGVEALIFVSRLSRLPSSSYCYCIFAAASFVALVCYRRRSNILWHHRHSVLVIDSYLAASLLPSSS